MVPRWPPQVIFLQNSGVFHLTKILGIFGGRGMRSCLTGTEFQFCKMENILGLLVQQCPPHTELYA